MDQFPVEIVIKILAQACFDDKATGCSLMLASKWLGEVIKPIRFEAVSLCGLSQLTQFAIMLEDLPPGLRKISHLFISGISHKEAEARKRVRNLELRQRAVDEELVLKTVGDNWDDEDGVDQVGLFDSDDIEYNYYQTNVEVKQKQAAFDSAFHKIIQQTAPSIRTLFVTTTFDSPTFPPFLMPNLTDFSITSACNTFTFPHPFPRLQRVHTDSCMHHRGEGSLNFRTNAPALEELRVTGIGEESGRFVAKVINHAHCMEAGGKAGLLFPDTMKRIILQQRQPPYGPGPICGNAFMQYERFTIYLLNTANCLAESEDRRVGFRLVVLEMLDVSLWLKGKVSGLCYSFDDARKDWLDVISGGRGCWNDSDAANYNERFPYPHGVFDPERY